MSKVSSGDDENEIKTTVYGFEFGFTLSPWGLCGAHHVKGL